MSLLLLKFTPDHARYVIWDAVAGTYHALGRRGDLERWGRYFNEPITPEMFDRADTTGTSDPDGTYGFDDTEIHVGALRGMPTELLPRIVGRGDLEAFVMAAEDGDRDAVQRLSRHAGGS